MDKPQSEILNDEQLIKEMEARKWEEPYPKHYDPEGARKRVSRTAKKNRAKNKQARASRKKNR